jgi:hypothetical protein
MTLFLFYRVNSTKLGDKVSAFVLLEQRLAFFLKEVVNGSGLRSDLREFFGIVHITVWKLGVV